MGHQATPNKWDRNFGSGDSIGSTLLRRGRERRLGVEAVAHLQLSERVPVRMLRRSFIVGSVKAKSRPRNQRCLRCWIAEKPGLPTEARLLRVSGEAQHCRQVAAQHDREPFAIRLQRDLVDQAAGDTGGFGLGFLALQALELEPFDVRAHLVLPGRAPETPFGESARSCIHIPEPYAPLAQSVFAAVHHGHSGTRRRGSGVARGERSILSDASCSRCRRGGARFTCMIEPKARNRAFPTWLPLNSKDTLDFARCGL